MADLSPKARAILAAAREHESPRTDVQARGWAELQERIATGNAQAAESGTHAPLTPRSRGQDLRFYAKCAAVSIGIALGGVLAVLGARVGVVTILEGDGLESMQAVRVASSSRGRRVAEPDRRTAQGVVDPRPVVPPGSARDPLGRALKTAHLQGEPLQASAGSASSSNRPGGSPSASTVTGVDAEVRLLRAAKRAEQPEQAWQLLQQHAQRFPQSPLAQERHVLQVEVLCRLGRQPQARAMAKVFLQQHPSSAFAGRVRRACP